MTGEVDAWVGSYPFLSSVEEQVKVPHVRHETEVIALLASVPASGSVGRGLATIGHGSDLTLLVVTLGPTAICAMACCLVVFLYCAGEPPLP